jgi:hypothetical protein
MEQEKTLTEVFQEIADNELGFLPPDPAVKKAFMEGFVQYMILIS